ncbi:MAG: glutathione ABC transporter permease [Minwuia thermotolerans]|nr:MAG: glutathione ABC transporter permease [Minwuia thermotolerans]
MLNYLIKRILQGVISIVGASAIIFAISRLDDPTLLLLPIDATPEMVENLRQRLGLDLPIVQQYLIFLGNALQGDFGNSYRWEQPALALILDRLPATLELAFAGLVFALALAIPFGVLSAVYRDSWFDNFAKLFAMLGQAMPNFWVGLLLILFVSVNLGWLPAFGREGFDSLIMPAIALGWYPVAAMTRMLRSTMLDVLDSDHVRMARAIGVPNRVVVWKYALRNAAVPLVTMLGIYFANMLSGAFVVEVIFAWPGMGRMVVEAMFARDFPLLQVGVLFSAILFVVVNLLVDLSYGVLDPRIRHD